MGVGRAPKARAHEFVADDARGQTERLPNLMLQPRQLGGAGGDLAALQADLREIAVAEVRERADKAGFLEALRDGGEGRGEGHGLRILGEAGCKVNIGRSAL